MSKLWQQNICELSFKHLHGDSTDELSYQSLFTNEKAQLILADPPYLLLTRRNKKGKLRDPKNAKINHEAVTRYENTKAYRHFLSGWMPQCVTHLDPQGTFIIWTNFLGIEPIKTKAQELGLHFHDEFLWGKFTKEGSGNETLARIYEVALIFKFTPKANLESDKELAMSVLTHYDHEKTADQFENHPNHKPYSCLKPLIKNYSKQGDLVFDPFTGSGSTPWACLKLERNCYGIELREKWATITRSRIKKAN